MYLVIEYYSQWILKTGGNSKIEERSGREEFVHSYLMTQREKCND